MGWGYLQYNISQQLTEVHGSAVVVGYGGLCVDQEMGGGVVAPLSPLSPSLLSVFYGAGILLIYYTTTVG